jgi:hypothetical protein
MIHAAGSGVLRSSRALAAQRGGSGVSPPYGAPGCPVVWGLWHTGPGRRGLWHTGPNRGDHDNSAHTRLARRLTIQAIANL